jgi:hypothetical protein
MGYSKKLANYTVEQIALIESVVNEGKTIKIRCDSLPEAKNFRLRLYGLRNAMMENHPLKDRAAGFQVVVDEKTFVITIQPPTLGHLDQRIIEGLEEAGVDVTWLK